MINIGTLLATLKIKDQLTPALAKAQQSLKNAGPKMKAVGRSMTMGVTVPLMAAGAAAVKFAVDMNKAMANIASLIPDSTARVVELKKTVQELAIATGASTSDMADGLYNVISALGDTADTEKILEINARAAAAGLATVTDAINLTSGVTKGYGDTTADATSKASDLAFTTVKLGQTTFPELAASLGRVIPIAAKLNLTQEELFATFATLTGVTGQTSMVSTQFAAVLTGLMKPTTGMTEAVAKLGFAGSEAMLRTLGFKETLDALIGTTDGSAEAVGKLFGSQEALVGIFALTGEQAGVYDEKLAALKVSVGATDEAFREQTQGVNAAGFAWKQLSTSFTVLLQKIGDELIPTFSALLSVLSSSVKWFSDLSPATKKVIVGVGTLAAALGPLLYLIGGMAMGITALTGAWVTYNVATKAVTVATWLMVTAQRALNLVMKLNPIGLVAFAITGLTVLILENWRAISNWITKIKESGLALRFLAAVMTGNWFMVIKLQKEIKENAEALTTAAKAQRDLTEDVEEFVPVVTEVTDTLAAQAPALARVTTELDDAAEAQKALNKRVSEQVTAWREGAIPAGREAMRVYKEFGGDLTQLSEVHLKKFNREVGEMNAHLVRTGQEVPDEQYQAWIKSHKILNPLVVSLADVIKQNIPFGRLVSKDFLAIDTMPLTEGIRHLKTLHVEALRAKGIFGQWGDAVKGGFANLWKGMTGGTGKISGLFSSLGSGIMDGFGQIISGGLSSLISMGVGLAMKGLGKLGGWITSRFGVGKAEKEGRELVRVFEDTVTAILSKEQKAEAGGKRWKEVVISVRDAYLHAGRSAEEAAEDVRKMWEASKGGAAAVGAITRHIQAVVDLGAQVQAMKNDWRGAEEAADRYGLSLDDLGPKFKARKWAEDVNQLTSDWQLLNIQGAKADTIARKMAPAVQGVIDKYREAGISIPASLKPVIEHQVEMGLLLDADGNKLTDLSSIEFAEPLVKQFSRIANSIEKLVDKLTGRTGITHALAEVNRTQIKDKSFTVTRQFESRGNNFDEMEEWGGRHGTGGRYVDFGAGTPAVLHGKERVMTEAEGRSEAASMVGVEKRLTSIERLLRDQPRAFGLAMSDTMNLQN